MVILSYGYKQPENGDRGSVWFPALNFNITRLNGHSHNGTDSAPINSANITKGTVNVPAASWVLVSSGKYSQVVTCPAGFNMDDYNITVKISGGDIIYPTIVRSSLTTFTIYTLDNALTYKAYFS